MKRIFNPSFAPTSVPSLHSRSRRRSDIYSLAITIYALGTRSYPLEHIGRDADACRATQEGERPQRPDSLGGLTKKETQCLWALMERMWCPIPRLRPTVSSARDEIMQSGLIRLKSPALIAASSTSVRSSTSTISFHRRNQILQVSTSSKLEVL